jgi:hypothetical protein
MSRTPRLILENHSTQTDTSFRILLDSQKQKRQKRCQKLGQVMCLSGAVSVLRLLMKPHQSTSAPRHFHANNIAAPGMPSQRSSWCPPLLAILAYVRRLNRPKAPATHQHKLVSTRRARARGVLHFKMNKNGMPLDHMALWHNMSRDDASGQCPQAAAYFFARAGRKHISSSSASSTRARTGAILGWVSLTSGSPSPSAVMPRSIDSSSSLLLGAVATAGAATLRGACLQSESTPLAAGGCGGPAPVRHCSSARHMPGKSYARVAQDTLVSKERCKADQG